MNGVLAVSRAFGNRLLRSVIRPDAEITSRELSRDDEFLVIASDGLWDVLKNKDVADVVYSMAGSVCSMPGGCTAIAEELARTAILRGSMDNVTCIVIRLKDYIAKIAEERSALIPPAQPVPVTQDIDASSWFGSGSIYSRPGTVQTQAHAQSLARMRQINEEYSYMGRTPPSVYKRPATGGPGKSVYASSQSLPRVLSLGSKVISGGSNLQSLTLYTDQRPLAKIHGIVGSSTGSPRRVESRNAF